MRASPTERRFTLNPVEVLILLMVCTGFGYSVYNVFQESEQFKFAALEPMQSNPTRSAARSPASTGAPLEIPCSENPGFNLRGKNCAPTSDQAPRLLNRR